MEDDGRLPGHRAASKRDIPPSPGDLRALELSGPAILLYPAGACLRPAVLPPNPTGKGRGRRGAVVGWSAASRRRMREALLTLDAPPGWQRCGVTCTIPGPPLPLSTAKRLWADFCRRLAGHAYGLIWRVEIQERGQLHWHGIAIRESRVHRIREEWMEALDRLGPFDFDPPVIAGGLPRSHVDSLAAWPGAWEHAVDVDDGRGGRVAWLRYLQDHATKTKQQQTPESIGRHWGIVGRGLWVRVLPESVAHLPWRVYCRVVRQYDRLTVPTIDRPGRAFGRRLGYRVHRGRRGRHFSFVRPDTMRRLIEWATREEGV